MRKSHTSEEKTCLTNVTWLVNENPVDQSLPVDSHAKILTEKCQSYPGVEGITMTDYINQQPDSILEFIASFMPKTSWHSMLLCCKKWNLLFKKIFTKKNYFDIQYLTLKFRQQPYSFCWWNYKDTVLDLKLAIIRKFLDPDWTGRQNTVNYFRFVKIVHGEQILENYDTLEFCGLKTGDTIDALCLARNLERLHCNLDLLACNVSLHFEESKSS